MQSSPSLAKQVVAMVDSGTTTTFISRQFVVKNRVVMQKLDHPILPYNIDGMLNCDGTVSDVAILELQVGEHCGHVVFMVTDIRAEDVIIGLDCLHKRNPDVDGDAGMLRLSGCPESCRTHRPDLTPAQMDMRDMGVRPTVRQSLKQQRRVRKVGAICATVIVEECVDVSPGAKLEWDNSEDTLLASWEEGRLLCEAPQLFAMVGYTYSQQRAEQEYSKKET